MSLDVQLIILGTGDPYYEALLRDFADKFKGKLSTRIMFSSSLAQKIYSGCDMFLMPSIFEPCGLSQLIALRYGTVPIVRGNGFSFNSYNAHDMLFTIKRALGFYKDMEVWSKLIVNSMNGEYSWSNSAVEYARLYKKE